MTTTDPAALRRASADALRERGIDVPAELPIAEHRDDLVAALGEHQVVVVAGETGSGKSTQLPKLCIAAGRGSGGLIGHTQPRRVAARTIAARVADELGVEVGAEVGVSVRFDDRVGDRTVVRSMTDGILLAEIQRDPDLSRYDTIIVDEAHERSLNVDVVLGYLAQLLPRRPDLHVVVTSATIDTERFAAHFADALGTDVPIVTVSGRTYPVEVRYRPYGDDPEADEEDRRDQVDAVLGACEELLADTGGDVLVFLSGEREIHDTADAVRARRWPGVEVLPLYARLSTAEQARVFQPHPGRRIVLATNVAETSITVPGVRSVVDAGTARISRYSRRLKVQRLPIEEISRASADQRAGRCGRVAPGVCIRLYGEESYLARPEFTEPEILRTNLASVVLQMANIGLGDVATFPFVEPPDHRSIRDGERLLSELGAVRRRRHDDEPVRLTKTGRRLARLPVDPRLGRMLLEADRLNCVAEVLVIVSALSIQDVRERPADQRERADQLHARFRVDGSDLLSIVALWDHVRARQRELSGNAFRRECRDEFLHVLRIREWMDLHRQLRRVASDLGIRSATGAGRATGSGARAEAHPDHVHRAVLSGLLSQIGRRESDRAARGAVYRGARQAEFVIAPGSVLTRRPPEWVMAAELVDTDRIRARRVAEIDPTWAEHLGQHLVKRSYGEARWDPERGRAVTTEQVTLFGLPLVSDRVVGLDRIDPELARRMFIRAALVDAEVPDLWRARHDVVRANLALRERLGDLTDRVRTRELLDDDDLAAFYDEVVPDDVTSIERFDRWRDDRRKNRARGAPGDVDDDLRLHETEVRRLLAERGVDLAGFPDEWTIAGVALPVTYRFAPGEPLDGVTVHVPLEALAAIPATALTWHIPGRRAELVDQTIRRLPKTVRKALPRLDRTIDDVLTRLGDDLARTADVGGGSLPERIASILGPLADVSVSPSVVSDVDLPDDLRVHVVVATGSGDDTEVLAVGDDLDEIRDRLRSETRSALARSSPVEERRGITSWDVGDLPRSIPVGDGVTAYPALLDVGGSVSLRIVSSPVVQARAMPGGVRRLLLLGAAPSRSSIARHLTERGRLTLASSDLGVDDVVDDCITAAVGHVAARSGPVPFTETEYRAIAGAVGDRAPRLAAAALARVVTIVDETNAVVVRLAQLRAPSARETVDDVNDHLGRLIRPGFVTADGIDRLGDIARYVRGIRHRLDHLAGAVARDRDRIGQVRPLEQHYRRLLDGTPVDAVDPAVADLRWALEELRVQVFAQPVGPIGDVSPAKIRARLADAARSATA